MEQKWRRPRALATFKQKQLLEELNVPFGDALTKEEASNLITSILTERHTKHDVDDEYGDFGFNMDIDYDGDPSFRFDD